MPALIKIDHSSPAANERAESVRFCSRCGAADEHGDDELRLVDRRVCEQCAMGVLLRCGRAALPAPGAPFLIATHSLEVSAVSEAAEVVLGPEEGLLGRNLLALLTSPLGDRKLNRAVAQAALRVHDPLTMPVRVAGERGDAVGTMAGRISTCGPPRAALLTLEPSDFGRR